MDYSVYVHTFPNGKRYVGITCQKPERRWKNGHAYQNQRYVWNAINKYGWHNIKHDVLYSGLSKFEACSIEQKLISDWKTTDRKYGYNLSIGGECGKSGVHLSEETRRKMSESHKGINTWAKGKKKTEEQIKKMCIHVMCVETGVIYYGGSEAHRKTGINQGRITQCCKGKRKSAGGFHWQYAVKEVI